MSEQSASRSRIVTVSNSHAGQRLDNFLLTQLKGVPRSHIYRIVRTGQVRVNSSRARPGSRLYAGDQVRIPPLRTSSRAAPHMTGSQRRLVEHILFEDAYLIVLDKPAGIAVHAGSGIPAGVIEWLRLSRPRCRYLELVHRLDRETSGCLLIAKQRRALLGLQAGMQQDSVHPHRTSKMYQALVKGQWRGGTQEVNAPLRKNALRSGERMVEVVECGLDSKTRLSPSRRYPTATLMDIEIFTGRTHQARVHAAYLGHPIAGDIKYGDRAFNTEMQQMGLHRLFLHASSLGFMHPVTGQRIEVESPLPDPLPTVLEALEHNAV